jgi:hypothetical protein
VLAALLLVIAGLGTWAGLSGSGSHHGRAMPSMSATPRHTKPAESALMKALVLTNQSADAKGYLPPSSCKQNSAAMVTCTAPYAGISGAVFRTYPSLTALYAAYTARVKDVYAGQFRQNFSDCGLEQTVGEAGWNHMFQHPKAYTVAQMSAGMVTDAQAVGRVFCTFTQGLEYIVWTQGDGRLLAYVAGPVHEDVWLWWVAIHHNIGLGGAAMNMNMGPSPAPGTTCAAPGTTCTAPAMSGTSPSMHATSPAPGMSGTSPSMHATSPAPAMSSMGA